MKKFFSISFFLHLIVLVLLLRHHFPQSHDESDNKSYVTIYLSPPPSSISTPPFKGEARGEMKAKKEAKAKKVAKEAKAKKVVKEAKAKKVVKEEFERFVRKQKINTTSQDVKTNSSNFSNIEKISYKQELYRYLKDKNHYPPMAAKLKQSGSLKVLITISKNGVFEKIALLESSKFRALNDGTLEFLNQIAKFKPLPKNQHSKTFEIPIVYKL